MGNGSDIAGRIKTLLAAGRPAPAEALCREWIENRDDPEGRYLFGMVCAFKKDGTGARRWLRAAAAALPGRPDIAYNLGVVLNDAGETAAAADAWRRVLAIDPSAIDARYNLARALTDLGDARGAADAYEILLREVPGHKNALFNLGNLKAGADAFPEAAALFERVLAMDPHRTDAWINLGLVRKQAGDLPAAEAGFRRAVALDPANADAHWHLAQALLLERRWAEGWAEYEWRLKRRGAPVVNPAVPSWDGRRLATGPLVLWAEQGLGDAIQFVRYARFAAERTDAVIVYCHGALARLFQSVPGVSRSVPFGGALPEAAAQAPLMSLPHRLDLPEPMTVWNGPYLTGASNPRPAAGGLRAGIAWAGNPEHENDRHRSLDLGRLEPLFEIPGVRWTSLQAGPRRADLLRRGLSHRVEDPMAAVRDMADTAGILAGQDLVVSVDTAVAHLAGAMGIPVCLLLPAVPDWRWGRKTVDTPWYPSTRLFRQRRLGDWAPVVATLKTTLTRAAESPENRISFGRSGIGPES